MAEKRSEASPKKSVARLKTAKKRDVVKSHEALEHRVAQARGLDPMGIVGRDEPAVSPKKPEPPLSR
jgi:hypothetical protein